MNHKAKRLSPAAADMMASRLKTASEPGLDRAVQARIGDNLRAMYDELLQQPVPDRFKDLLGQLDTQTGSKEQSR